MQRGAALLSALPLLLCAGAVSAQPFPAKAVRIRDRISSMGADVIGSTPDQFGVFMKSASAKWGKVIREVNIKAE